MHHNRQEILEPADGGTGYPTESPGWADFRDGYSAAEAALFERRAALEYLPVYATGDQVSLAFYGANLSLRDEYSKPIARAAYAGRAEKELLGRDLDTVALKLGIETLRDRPDIRLAVPSSARSLADTRWRQELETGLASNPYLGERLILEMDEPSVMDLHEVVGRFMAEMQGHGVAFALGRFGAGATNFQHLRRFHFDLVSIDRSFVKGIETDPDNQVVVGALVYLVMIFALRVRELRELTGKHN
jgi:EAL domain-containing protein (putative c-di-GMP-specific phosphodiesterase class I)